MENKAILSVVLSIVSIIGGMVLNFQQFLMGSTASEKNLIVTLVYMVIWILAIAIGVKSKSYRIIRCFSVFWTATSIVSLITVYVKLTGISAVGAIPFVILLLTQWYGVTFFINEFLTSAIIISVISFVLIITCLRSLKNIKSDC